jgi:hypothetical protein
MNLGCYIGVLSVPVLIISALLYSGASFSQVPPIFDPPSVARVRQAIDKLPDTPAKQKLADATRAADPVFIILPGILGSRRTMGWRIQPSSLDGRRLASVNGRGEHQRTVTFA